MTFGCFWHNLFQIYLIIDINTFSLTHTYTHKPTLNNENRMPVMTLRLCHLIIKLLIVHKFQITMSLVILFVRHLDSWLIRTDNTLHWIHKITFHLNFMQLGFVFACFFSELLLFFFARKLTQFIFVIISIVIRYGVTQKSIHSFYEIAIITSVFQQWTNDHANTYSFTHSLTLASAIHSMFYHSFAIIFNYLWHATLHHQFTNYRH